VSFERNFDGALNQLERSSGCGSASRSCRILCRERRRERKGCDGTEPRRDPKGYKSNQRLSTLTRTR
jgi:hypothetical protein